MADVKISNLPASTVPLAGTEVLPIVQSGVTKKVATDDLTVKNVRSNATNGILQVVGPAAAATRIMTTPDANFTAARIDAGQTFTGVNTFTSPKIITDISDTNGNELLKVTATASAVNEITVANAATGNNPVLSATGSDTNIGITLTPKGTGNAVLTSGNLVIGTSGKGINTASAIPATFNINDVEAARIHASRGVSIGNTIDPGAGNFSVTGATSSSSFYSQMAVLSVPNSTATTAFSTSFGSYMMTAYLPNGASAYVATCFIVDDASYVTISGLNTGANINITNSGAFGDKAIKITQTSGAPQNILWSVIRMPAP
jgi:hypothetical protein